MAFETGVANDHLDLWDKLHTFLTANPALVAAGEAWDVPWEVTQADGVIQRVYRNRGTGVGRDVLVGVAFQDTGLADNNRINLRGVVEVIPSATNYTQHMNVSDYVSSYFQNSPMRYWFVASGRRFIIVYKVSTTYHTLYGGFFLPYATPVAYPYPLMVGGCFAAVGQSVQEPLTWRDTSVAHTTFFCPGPYNTTGGTSRTSQLKILGNDALWGDVAGSQKTGTTNNNRFGLGPLSAPLSGTGAWSVNEDFSYTSGQVGFASLLDMDYTLLGGGYGLRPLRVFSTASDADGNRPTIGDLDGIFYVDGGGNASENIVTINGVDHLVFQNIFRTGLRSYAALRLS